MHLNNLILILILSRCWLICKSLIVSGAPREIRTPDPLIRSQVLYPAELSVLNSRNIVRYSFMQERSQLTYLDYIVF